MSIQNASLVVAAASIVMGSGGAVNYQENCTIERTAAGTYLVTVDPTVALDAAMVHISKDLELAPTVAGSVVCPGPAQTTVDGVEVTQFTFTTSATLGGSAADVVGTLTLEIHKPSEGIVDTGI
jgi:hypothetical protein